MRSIKKKPQETETAMKKLQFIFPLVMAIALQSSAETKSHSNTPADSNTRTSAPGLNDAERTQKAIEILAARGKKARVKVGLTDKDPQPMMDYLKANPAYAQKHLNEIEGIIRGDVFSFDALTKDLAKDKDFQAMVDVATQKKAGATLGKAAATAVIAHMSGKAIPEFPLFKAIAAQQAVEGFEILKGEMLKTGKP